MQITKLIEMMLRTLSVLASTIRGRDEQSPFGKALAHSTADVHKRSVLDQHAHLLFQGRESLQTVRYAHNCATWV